MGSETITIQYAVPENRLPPEAFRRTRAVRLAETLDLRGKDPRFLMNKLTLSGGPASGAYLADKPVSEIVHHAIGEALACAGLASGEENAALQMTVRLEGMDFKVMVGFAQCMLKGVMTASVTLVEPGPGPVVWEGKAEGSGRAGTGNLVQAAFTSALDDLIHNILACPALG